MRSVLKFLLIGAFYILLESYELVEHDYVITMRKYMPYTKKTRKTSLKARQTRRCHVIYMWMQ